MKNTTSWFTQALVLGVWLLGSDSAYSFCHPMARGISFAAAPPTDTDLAYQHRYGPPPGADITTESMAGLTLSRFSTNYQEGNETGFAYCGHRYYCPRTGRWLSRDPVGETASENVYGTAVEGLVNKLDILGLWTRNKWSGGWGQYSGKAFACSSDSLPELARLITGDPSDWQVLGIQGELKPGQEVNVAPLLVILETRIRRNVVTATSTFRIETFGLPVTSFEGSGSGGVSRFFGSGRGLMADCHWGVLLTIAKGLLDTLGTEDFDKLEYRFNTYPRTSTTKTLSEVSLGDAIYLENYNPHPRGWAWQGENVIKIGEDAYWGITGAGTGRARSIEMWLNFLRVNYKAEINKRPKAPLPGFQGSALFVNVPKVGMEVFDLRRGKKPR